mgnify:CR=1 FL=1|jgi:hypothetical protein
MQCRPEIKAVHTSSDRASPHAADAAFRSVAIK